MAEKIFKIERVKELPLVGTNGDWYILQKTNGRHEIYIADARGNLVFNKGITDAEQEKLTGLKTQAQITADIEEMGQQAGGQIIPITGTVLPQGVNVPSYITTKGKAELIGGAGGTTFTQSGGPSTTVSEGSLRIGYYDRTTNLWSFDSVEKPLPTVTGTDVLNPTGTGVPKEKATAEYVGKSAIDILDLKLEDVIVDAYIPEIRSLNTFTNNYTSPSYYYEGSNHRGVKQIFVKANSAGTINLGIIVKVNGSTSSLIESKTVSVVVGVNTFNIEDVGFNENNLKLPEFFIGASPITAGTLRFQVSTEGALQVMVTSNGSVTSTTQKGCVWVLAKNVPETILGSYPETKALLESTINNENTFTKEVIPEDRNGIIMAVAGSNLVVYGESEIYYNTDSKFVNLNIYAQATGLADVFFVKISGIIATVVSQSQVSCLVGKNTFTKSQLNAPEDEVENIYVFVGNNETKTPNVLHGASGYSKIRPWYTLTKSTGALIIGNSAQRFSFWIEVDKPVNLLVAEVSRLTEIVNNLPSRDSDKVYDYTNNYPILPSDIFINTNSISKGTAIYKSSLFQKFINNILPDIQLVSDNVVMDLKDPSYIKSSDVGATARLLINKQLVDNTILYKDINIRKFDSATKTGILTWMSLGDSLTEGGAGFTSSPIFLITQKLATLGVTVQGTGAIQRTNGAITQRYEGRGGWRYRTFVGLEPKFSGLNQKIASPTKNVWIEGTDGTINDIKSFNPFLYEATAQDKIDYPQWCFNFVEGSNSENVSYAQNPSLGTYHIFSPARYFSERGITIPNVISIALGTNEWYLGGYSAWDLTKILNCAEWMITRFLSAVPTTTKLLIVPCNNMPLTREVEWQEKASILTSAILKIIENKKITNTNIFGLSIFAHGSRQMAYNLELTNSNLSINNTTKLGIVDADVHILNTNDQGRYDYIQSLSDAVLFLKS